MKEKRIYCIEVSGECQNLVNIPSQFYGSIFKCKPGLYCSKNVGWKPITKDACKNCKEGRYQGITRKQFIDGIMRTLCAQVYGPCEECEHKKTKGCKWHRMGYRTYAEAILKTILEYNNDSKN